MIQSVNEVKVKSESVMSSEAILNMKVEKAIWAQSYFHFLNLGLGRQKMTRGYDMHSIHSDCSLHYSSLVWVGSRLLFRPGGGFSLL